MKQHTWPNLRWLINLFLHWICISILPIFLNIIWTSCECFNYHVFWTTEMEISRLIPINSIHYVKLIRVFKSSLYLTGDLVHKFFSSYVLIDTSGATLRLPITCIRLSQSHCIWTYLIHPSSFLCLFIIEMYWSNFNISLMRLPMRKVTVRRWLYKLYRWYGSMIWKMNQLIMSAWLRWFTYQNVNEIESISDITGVYCIMLRIEKSDAIKSLQFRWANKQIICSWLECIPIGLFTVCSQLSVQF